MAGVAKILGWCCIVWAIVVVIGGLLAWAVIYRTHAAGSGAAAALSLAGAAAGALLLATIGATAVATGQSADAGNRW